MKFEIRIFFSQRGVGPPTCSSYPSTTLIDSTSSSGIRITSPSAASILYPFRVFLISSLDSTWYLVFRRSVVVTSATSILRRGSACNTVGEIGEGQHGKRRARFGRSGSISVVRDDISHGSESPRPHPPSRPLDFYPPEPTVSSWPTCHLLPVVRGPGTRLHLAFICGLIQKAPCACPQSGPMSFPPLRRPTDP